MLKKYINYILKHKGAYIAMVLVRISDGLGNQMFQYALGRSLALKRGKVLKLDITSFSKNYKLRNYLLNEFSIISYNLTLFERVIYSKLHKYIYFVFSRIKLIHSVSAVYKEKKTYEFDKNIYTVNKNYFFGYWQNCKYFKNIRSNLLEEFAFKEKLNDKNKITLQKIKNTNSVSIHVRRGDYLIIDGQEVCTIEYYQKAIDFISSQISNPTFYIFSDDIAWVIKNLIIDKEIYYMDFNNYNPEYDLELMKNCKHNIIANSTFSWWGAWLNRNKCKLVVAPKEWKKGFLTPDGLSIENWILL